MAKFFVGQRVRLVKHQQPSGRAKPVPLGDTGVITRMRFAPAGAPTRVGPLVIDSNCIVIFKQGGERSSHTSLLEPILPEGSAPSEFTLQQLMDSLQEVSA